MSVRWKSEGGGATREYLPHDAVVCGDEEETVGDSGEEGWCKAGGGQAKAWSWSRAGLDQSRWVSVMP